MLRVLAPTNPDLALFSSLKSELGSKTTANDNVLRNILTRASKVLANAVGRPLHRQQYREAVKSSGVGKVFLSNTPVVGTVTAYWMNDPFDDFDSTTLTQVDDMFVANSGAGVAEVVGHLKHTMRVLPGIEYNPMVGTEIPLLRVDYWGGWHPPSSAYEAATISFTASDQSINDSASGFSTTIQKEDVIEVTGAGVNNGFYRVKTATTAKLTVAGVVTITDATAGPKILVNPRNLPGDLEDAALALAKTLWFSRKRDLSARMESAQDIEVWYARERDVGFRFPTQINEVVKAYRRVFA